MCFYFVCLGRQYQPRRVPQRFSLSTAGGHAARGLSVVRFRLSFAAAGSQLFLGFCSALYRVSLSWRSRDHVLYSVATVLYSLSSSYDSKLATLPSAPHFLVEARKQKAGEKKKDPACQERNASEPPSLPVPCYRSRKLDAHCKKQINRTKKSSIPYGWFQHTFSVGAGGGGGAPLSP